MNKRLFFNGRRFHFFYLISQWIKKKQLLFLLPCLFLLNFINAQTPTYRIGIIGDYGGTGTGFSSEEDREKEVALLVDGWNTANALDALLTMGDNNYGRNNDSNPDNNDGDYGIIHENIGAYYSKYIPDPNCNECGNCIENLSGIGGNCIWGTGNRFWPCIGNHDFHKDDDDPVIVEGVGYAPYLAYFQLPNNERFTKDGIPYVVNVSFSQKALLSSSQKTRPFKSREFLLILHL